MSVRDHRQGKVRKGTSDLVRTSQRHVSRRTARRSDTRSLLQRRLNEWADEMEGNSIWTD